MSHLWFILSRLWRYHALYFLKPNDAVNDTLTASLLFRLDWSGPVVEIGSGDGVYSYVMHGGSFPLAFDRYLITDLDKTDIYDTHTANVLRPNVVLTAPEIVLALDAKVSHVEKIKEIGFAKEASVVAYESLPFASASVKKIFYYTPHGLRDHEKSVSEASRVLEPGGEMLILLYDSAFKSSFLCHRFSSHFGGRLGAFFARLDGGRYDEITRLARTPTQWSEFFETHGFEIVRSSSGLSTFAWKVYDTQTRPILKPLIRIFGWMPRRVRTAVKLLWMIVAYPYLVLFYLLFSNEYLRIGGPSCYLAYQLKKANK